MNSPRISADLEGGAPFEVEDRLQALTPARVSDRFQAIDGEGSVRWQGTLTGPRALAGCSRSPANSCNRGGQMAKISVVVLAGIEQYSDLARVLNVA